MDHMTGNPEIDQWISLLGTLVPVASMVAGILNQKIRTQGAQNPLMLNAVAILNLFAVNFDKAMQLMAMAKEMRASMATMDPKAPADAEDTTVVDPKV